MNSMESQTLHRTFHLAAAKTHNGAEGLAVQDNKGVVYGGVIVGGDAAGTAATLKDLVTLAYSKGLQGSEPEGFTVQVHHNNILIQGIASGVSYARVSVKDGIFFNDVATRCSDTKHILEAMTKSYCNGAADKYKRAH